MKQTNHYGHSEVTFRMGSVTINFPKDDWAMEPDLDSPLGVLMDYKEYLEDNDIQPPVDLLAAITAKGGIL